MSRPGDAGQGGREPPRSGPLAGLLLVATPLISTAPFHTSVILLVEHDERGAVGVVLTRPRRVLVREAFAALAGAAAAPAVLFSGGPVSPEVTVCLSATAGRGLTAWTMVDAGTAPAPTGPLRLFSGYAGWAAGQLEQEIAAGAWWVVAARSGDVFSPQPEMLWRSVLRRSPPPLCYASTWTVDPGRN